jgi:hypothetical protein
MCVTDCTIVPFVLRKKNEIISDGGDCGIKKCKKVYGGTYDGVRAESTFGGIQGICTVLVFSARLWLQSP